ncbi:hypothetical protein ABPG72_021205 [Tetrahymena utriculariae]
MQRQKACKQLVQLKIGNIQDEIKQKSQQSDKFEIGNQKNKINQSTQVEKRLEENNQRNSQLQKVQDDNEKSHEDNAIKRRNSKKQFKVEKEQKGQQKEYQYNLQQVKEQKDFEVETKQIIVTNQNSYNQGQHQIKYEQFKHYGEDNQILQNSLNDNLNKQFNDQQMGIKIAEGGFGCVYDGKIIQQIKKDEKQCALKIIGLKQEEEQEKVEEEVQIMRRFEKNINTLQLIDYLYF